ncbi:MAG TPA: hypothetical protein VN753_18650, partial [Terracidiphilus sp.]|nr:hypothetical protein [Terracidiphilus sp.]
EAPVAGHGAGSFVAAAALAPDDTAHNTPLTILVEGGLFAFLPASAILFVCCSAIGRSRRSVGTVLAILMSVWILSSLVGSIAENRITWLFFGIAAVSGRLGRNDRDELSHLFDADLIDCSRERMEVG